MSCLLVRTCDAVHVIVRLVHALSGCTQVCARLILREVLFCVDITCSDIVDVFESGNDGPACTECNSNCVEERGLEWTVGARSNSSNAAVGSARTLDPSEFTPPKVYLRAPPGGIAHRRGSATPASQPQTSSESDDDHDGAFVGALGRASGSAAGGQSVLSSPLTAAAAGIGLLASAPPSSTAARRLDIESAGTASSRGSSGGTGNEDRADGLNFAGGGGEDGDRDGPHPRFTGLDPRRPVGIDQAIARSRATTAVESDGQGRTRMSSSIPATVSSSASAAASSSAAASAAPSTQQQQQQAYQASTSTLALLSLLAGPDGGTVARRILAMESVASALSASNASNGAGSGAAPLSSSPLALLLASLAARRGGGTASAAASSTLASVVDDAAGPGSRPSMTIGDYAFGDISALIARIYAAEVAAGNVASGSRPASQRAIGTLKRLAVPLSQSSMVVEPTTGTAAAGAGAESDQSTEECAVCHDSLFTDEASGTQSHSTEASSRFSGAQAASSDGPHRHHGHHVEVADPVQMPCGHSFHAPCLLPWLEQHNTCPVCRHELPTDDEAYNRSKGLTPDT